MVTALLQQTESANNMIISASKLAKSLKKDFGVLCFVESDEQVQPLKEKITVLLEKVNIENTNIFVLKNTLNDLTEVCEQFEASFLFLQLTENKGRKIQKQLNACRELRIPYLIYKDTFSLLDLAKVMMPVTFLEEEYEKAQFASAFGRFCNSDIQILLANDYGSKAAKTAEKMTQLFDKFDLKYTLTKGKTDSFKVEKESVKQAENDKFGIILLSASRDYGLDDMIFGPKEQHLVKKSAIPVLLINPRGDLYALCD